MIQKLKCIFGFHKEKRLGFKRPFYQQVLMKCDCCGKYNVCHTGIGANYWTKNKRDIHAEMRKYIEENNL